MVVMALQYDGQITEYCQQIQSIYTQLIANICTKSQNKKEYTFYKRFF